MRKIWNGNYNWKKKRKKKEKEKNTFICFRNLKQNKN